MEAISREAPEEKSASGWYILGFFLVFRALVVGAGIWSHWSSQKHNGFLGLWKRTPYGIFALTEIPTAAYVSLLIGLLVAWFGISLSRPRVKASSEIPEDVVGPFEAENEPCPEEEKQNWTRAEANDVAARAAFGWAGMFAISLVANIGLQTLRANHLLDLRANATIIAGACNGLFISSLILLPLGPGYRRDIVESFKPTRLTVSVILAGCGMAVAFVPILGQIQDALFTATTVTGIPTDIPSTVADMVTTLAFKSILFALILPALRVVLRSPSQAVLVAAMLGTIASTPPLVMIAGLVVAGWAVERSRSVLAGLVIIVFLHLTPLWYGPLLGFVR